MRNCDALNDLTSPRKKRLLEEDRKRRVEAKKQFEAGKLFFRFNVLFARSAWSAWSA